MAVDTITHPKWGETRRETGMGHVVEYDAPEGKRNAHVAIAADGLRHPLTGWVDTHSVALTVLEAAKLSKLEGRRVRYAIEVHRKASVAADGRGLDELDKTEKVRDLVELELLGAGERDLEGERTAPPAAPTSDAPPPAEPPPDYDDRPRPRTVEAKPWEPANSDGSDNLGSYAVTACLGMVELALVLLVAHWHAGGSTGEKRPTVGQASTLGKRLLFCADRVQAAARADGKVDRMDGSHTRARGAIRSALVLEPPPFGTGPEDVEPWQDALSALATRLFAAGVGLLDTYEEVGK